MYGKEPLIAKSVEDEGHYHNHQYYHGNLSDTNSEISASESVANNMTNIVKIYEEEEEKIPFIDFLGVGATWKLITIAKGGRIMFFFWGGGFKFILLHILWGSN